MARKFRRADHEATLAKEIKIGDALPADHLSRFVVEVIKLLDLSKFYAHYAESGGMPYEPELLLGVLVYGYATGVFSSRGMEQATYERLPFRYIAGELHPDHDTINTFRSTFLSEIKELFVQVLLMAQMMGYLKVGDISLDGTKIHADASKSKAVSYKRLQELEVQFGQEIDKLFALAEQMADGPEGASAQIDDEIQRREERLAKLAAAKAVIEARAQERYEAEQADYDAKMAARQEKERRTGRKPGGRTPQPPSAGPRDKDQYNFTDPESRIMKNGNNAAFEQSYNGQAAVSHGNRFIVANTLSNHPNDQQEALPTIQAIPSALGRPHAAALDNGYFSQDTVHDLAALGIEPYIAPGRQAHHPAWQSYLGHLPDPPDDDAPLTLKMAYKLQTAVGKAIYRLRKSTVEPVIGILKEVMGFRQFSLRGLVKAAGEWNLICLAYNFRRLHVMHTT